MKTDAEHLAGEGPPEFFREVFIRLSSETVGIRRTREPATGKASVAHMHRSALKCQLRRTC
jgi:hypothetical protein